MTVRIMRGEFAGVVGTFSAGNSDYVNVKVLGDRIDFIVCVPFNWVDAVGAEL